MAGAGMTGWWLQYRNRARSISPQWFGFITFALLTLLLVLAIHLEQRTGMVFNPPLLLPTLNIIFISLSGFIVCYLAARAFVHTGIQAALWLGAGAYVFGLCNLISGFTTETIGANFAVTVHNSGTLLSAMFNLAGAVTAYRVIVNLSTSRRTVTIVYGAGLAWMILISVTAYYNLAPVFFVTGAGGTMLRWAVLGSSILLFALSGSILQMAYLRTGSHFWILYSWALLSIAFGLSIITFGKTLGDPLNWMGRIAQYTGGGFLLAASVSAVREARARQLSVEEVIAEFIRRARFDYKQLLEAAQEGIWISDTKGKTIFVNRKMADMLGYTREELQNIVGVNLVMKEFHALGLQWREELAKGNKIQHEVKFRRKDGSVLWTIANATAIYDKAGSHYGNLYMHTDITERKKADEALQQSEEKYRSIVTISNEGIWVVDAERNTNYVNDRMATMLGYTVSEMMTLSWAELTDKEGQAISNKLIEERKQGATGAASYDYKLIRKDGTPLWVTVNASPLYDADGRYAGSVSMLTDITERKKAERQQEEMLKQIDSLSADLLEDNRLLQSIMENAGAHLAYFNPQFNFVMVNSTYAKSCGYTAEELIGKNHFVLFPDEENEDVFKRVRDLGVPVSFHDKPFTFPNQPWRGVTYWDWTLAPVKDAAGNT
ncbi:MAG: PAS domain-containing protein, partial [Dehalococcoidales bacterium]|nr:PAS domain-containing protein [Dehalococcoidales bacterium]